MRSCIFVGLCTIDIVYGVDRFPQPNSKVVARSQDVWAGGPAANAAITFAHLGGHATLVTVLGRHPMTSTIHEELRRYSVQLIDLNPDFAGVPVISSVYVSATGERNVVSANATRVPALPPQVDEEVLDRAEILLVDGHYMQACQAWAKAARSRGKQTVFDGGSWKPGTGELLKSIDTAICSSDFLPPGCSTEDAVIECLRDYGVTNVAITKGAEPVRFESRGDSGVVEVPKVEAVDTMGAGDIFHGAFCYYASTGCGFVESLKRAGEIAAGSCRFPGTREWMKPSSGKP